MQPIWDSLLHTVLEPLGSPVAVRDWSRMSRFVDADPALLAHMGAVAQQDRHLLADAIAERTGTDTATDLFPNLAAAATEAAVVSIAQLWSGGRSTAASVTDLVVETFAQLRAGIPAPQ